MRRTALSHDAPHRHATHRAVLSLSRCVLVLLALMAANPYAVYINRGNHEVRARACVLSDAD